MDAFEQELRRCLDDLDTERTAVVAPRNVPTPAAAPAPEYARPAPRRHVLPRRGRRVGFGLALAVLLAFAAIAAGLIGLGGSGGRQTASRGGPGVGSGSAVTLSGVTDYDPQGSGGEHSDTASAATDGNPATSWETETYANQAFGGLKDGLGLVLDAGRAVALKSLTVNTPTPGFVADVRAGDTQNGPFTPDSASQTVGTATTFDLRGATARYYVLWITRLPPGRKAEVSEVAATR
jgi:hypothetical protein